jgi:hypothetical protein
VIEDVLEAAVANQCVKESTPRTLIQNLSRRHNRLRFDRVPKGP